MSGMSAMRAASRARSRVGHELGQPLAGSIGAGLAIQSALVISGPLLARMLGVDARGHVAALVLWPALLGWVFTAGVPLALTYHLARGTHPQLLLPTAARLFAVLAALALLTNVAILLVYLRGEPRALRMAGWITLAMGSGWLAQQFGLAVLQGVGRFRAFNVLRLLPPLVYVPSVVVLFITHTGSVRTVVAATSAGHAFAGAAALALAWHALRCAPVRAADAPSARTLLHFGGSAMVGSTSPVEALRLDELTAAIFLGPGVLGLYVVGEALSGLPTYIARGFGMVAYPAVAALHDPAAAQRTVWRLALRATAASLAVCVPLAVAAPWLVTWFFGTSFASAAPIARLLLLGAVFATARRVLGDGLRGRGHPAAATIAEVASWAWLAPALAIGTLAWGGRGVAFAVASAQVAGLAALLLYARRIGEAPRLHRPADHLREART